ncbi:hypothetical protein SAMN05216376_11027 [Mameliella alba]|uniref:hypothetical protein n=2 Tax=Mameliella alba TaxID=561184 RepID=UPI00089086AA|nr:hypothetical protein [Mameliella alba]OWV46807.1 hypothetical protein CDZ96_17470 [Mameliella alba]PTR37726.1 hypothetical protein LX94_03546 [Mameliella alba]GGF50517.1 hypothetical protein GCM10011319_10120 [Mameliella alba]SDD62577.1 hypothetical protein SAMN05216376_11027 [Mameliella alba]
MPMRRAGFAWMSMMDLLFGLFGALVILTVLITLKLGADSGVEKKPFQMFTFEVFSDKADVQSALARMSLGLRVAVPDKAGCAMGASFDTERCEAQLSATRDQAPVKYRTSVQTGGGGGGLLSAALFIGNNGPLELTPFLANTPVFEEMVADRGSSLVTIRMGLKFGDLFWSPAPFCMTVDDVISLASTDEQGLAPLDICTLQRCKDGQQYSPCGTKEREITTKGGKIVFK